MVPQLKNDGDEADCRLSFGVQVVDPGCVQHLDKHSIFSASPVQGLACPELVQGKPPILHLESN